MCCRLSPTVLNYEYHSCNPPFVKRSSTFCRHFIISHFVFKSVLILLYVCGLTFWLFPLQSDVVSLSLSLSLWSEEHPRVALCLLLTAADFCNKIKMLRSPKIAGISCFPLTLSTFRRQLISALFQCEFTTQVLVHCPRIWPRYSCSCNSSCCSTVGLFGLWSSYMLHYLIVRSA